MNNNYWLILVVAAIVVTIYWLVPALKLKANTNKLIKGVIFGGVMVALTVDFVSKEKYSYVIVLMLGAIGFFVMLRDSKSK